jgi:membrane protein
MANRVRRSATTDAVVERPGPATSWREWGRAVLRRWWTTLAAALAHWNRDEGFLLSAAMAYYAAVSLFPLLLVLIAGLGMLLRLAAMEGAEQQILNAVADTAGPWLSAQLGRLLAGVQRQAVVGGPLGVAGLVLAAVGMFAQFDGMLERIWDAPRAARPGLRGALHRALVDRLLAFCVLLAVGGLVVLVFVCDLALATASRYIAGVPGGHAVGHLAQGGVTLLLNAAALAVIYKVLPRARVRWRHAAYGLVGTFLAVMLWVYYASATLFFGAEVVWAAGLSALPEAPPR